MPDTLNAIRSDRLSIGDRVVIQGLPEGLLNGLPKEEADFLATIVGSEGTVDEVSGPDSISVRLADHRSGALHFVWFGSEHLQRCVD